MYLFSALVALVVSMAVIGGQRLLSSEKAETAVVHTVPGVAAQNVLYTKDAQGNLTPLDFTDTSEKVLDAVVHIKATQGAPAADRANPRELPDPFRQFFGDRFRMPEGNPPQGPRVGTGSGVIIHEKGFIVTNNHVIDNATELEVTLHNNETYAATVIGTDPTTDLALIQIKAEGLKTMSLVNSDDVKVGEWVLAIGNPFSLTSTVTAGIVSAKARNININKEQFAVESFIQTDAAINPGNSGGALVNLEGNLVGINTAIASRTGSYTGYGFAVPSNIVTKVVEDLLKYGGVQRGMLGVSIRTMDGNLAKEKYMPFVKGVWIEDVAQNSAADKAGMKAGDVLVQIDGKNVATSPQLQEIVAQHRPGDVLATVVDRNGKKITLEIVLENAQGSTDMVEKEYGEVLRSLGATLKTVDEATAKKLNLDGGVEVTDLVAGQLRQQTQMAPGFIITHADGEEVHSAQALIKLLESKKGGLLLEGVYPDRPGKKYYALGLE
ncbi:Do family serine endopeptidase [Maribacter sp. 2307ULW6-5]|uniref:Do family serine endopeptidase n=1 Tax=Maribacter sp. 2307ULW6-5 TaxID=3386275 RepID=UPI0039BD865A